MNEEQHGVDVHETKQQSEYNSHLYCNIDHMFN